VKKKIPVKKSASMSAPKVHPWKNQIVRSAEVSPEKLLASPFNWRVHQKAQTEAMVGILDELGWVQKIIVNEKTGHIVDGHLRVQEAMRREEKTVPVDYISVSKSDEKKIIVTLNSVGAMAKAKPDILESLLNEVHFEQRSVDPVLAELAASIDLDDAGGEKEKPEVAFTEELLEEHNFVVLYFDNSVDWLNLLSILDLPTVKALHARDGFMSAGVGRVVKGNEAIARIQAAKEVRRKK